MTEANELPDVPELPTHLERLYRDRTDPALGVQVTVWRNGRRTQTYRCQTLRQAATMARGVVRIANMHRPHAAYQWSILGTELKCGTVNWLENDTVCYVSELPM